MAVNRWKKPFFVLKFHENHTLIIVKRHLPTHSGNTLQVSDPEFMVEMIGRRNKDDQKLLPLDSLVLSI